MRTYVMMTKVSSSEASLIEVGRGLKDRARNCRDWLEAIRTKCPEVRFIAHYAILGHWDFMDIYEAPDDEVAAKVSLITRAYGAHKIESWPAIPSDQLNRIREELEDLELYRPGAEY